VFFCKTGKLETGLRDRHLHFIYRPLVRTSRKTLTTRRTLAN